MAASDSRLRALLVDPALFTDPYDAALSRGLAAQNVSTLWATRGLRFGETAEISAGRVAEIFYPGLESSAKRLGAVAKARKGISHLASTRRLVALSGRAACDVVHFQWLILPLADLVAIRLLRRRMPVVITVHDTSPFNGDPTSRLQIIGFGAALRAADHVVVHTARGREALLSKGLKPDGVSVIPHGPLALSTHCGVAQEPQRNDPRWTFVLFGRLQDYKGADVLIDALAAIKPQIRSRLRVIIAGEPFVDVEELRRRAAQLGVTDAIEWQSKRLTEMEMAELFAKADTFVFPYRRIEASGVYYLVRDLGKWIVASDLGAFAEEISPQFGRLVPPSDAQSLATAIVDAVGRRPIASEITGPSWQEIGSRLADLYERLLDRRRN